jgi:hypothetical protein
MYTLLHKAQTGYGAHRASYPMVAGELPKGKSGQSVGLAIYYDLGLRSKMLQLNVYSSIQRPDRLLRQKASYPMDGGEHHKGMKRPKRGADNSLRPRADIKNPRATCILSSTTSRPAMAPKEVPIQWLQGNFPRA